MSLTVCLVTTGQPSSNPRAVKEADALVAAGYRVHMVGAHWARWADETDADLMASRHWTCELVPWRVDEAPLRFWYTRVRHAAARAAADNRSVGSLWLSAAVSRLTPELMARARRCRADLFIAHNLGALPAAVEAARRRGTPVGFDAEDYHSGQFSPSDRSASWRTAVAAERRWIPRCDYVTAASPGIAEAYAGLCRKRPVLIRNVFPLRQRPAEPPAGSADEVLRLYWFSQSIGGGRGLEDVVQAMGRLPTGSVELHVRGAWYGDYERELRAVARQAGVPQEAVVGHPPAPPEEMIRLAARWDVGLVPETGHTPNSDLLQSNKAFSYLLAGVPMLSSNTSGHRALLAEAGGAGWLVEPGDVSGLADRLAQLRADRKIVRDAAQRAWHWGTVRFNWETEQRSLLAQVEGVLGSDAAAASA